jgi:hypothetical protein
MIMNSITHHAALATARRPPVEIAVRSRNEASRLVPTKTDSVIVDSSSVAA